MDGFNSLLREDPKKLQVFLDRMPGMRFELLILPRLLEISIGSFLEGKNLMKWMNFVTWVVVYWFCPQIGATMETRDRCQQQTSDNIHLMEDSRLTLSVGY